MNLILKQTRGVCWQRNRLLSSIGEKIKIKKKQRNRVEKWSKNSWLVYVSREKQYGEIKFYFSDKN